MSNCTSSGYWLLCNYYTYMRKILFLPLPFFPLFFLLNSTESRGFVFLLMFIFFVFISQLSLSSSLFLPHLELASSRYHYTLNDLSHSLQVRRGAKKCLCLAQGLPRANINQMISAALFFPFVRVLVCIRQLKSLPALCSDIYIIIIKLELSDRIFSQFKSLIIHLLTFFESAGASIVSFWGSKVVKCSVGYLAIFFLYFPKNVRI